MTLIKASAGNQPSRSKLSLRNAVRSASKLLIVVLVVWLVAWTLAELLIVREPLAKADAIAVMAGSTTYEERAQRAAELYATGHARKIILTNDDERSGWSVAEQRNIPYQELAERMLWRLGVPAEAVERLPDPVSGTYDEAIVLREYAEARGFRSLLVVTSAYHSRRTLWMMRQTFDKSSITIGVEPVPPGQQTPSPVTWWLHSKGWELVPGEYIKMINHLLRYE